MENWKSTMCDLGNLVMGIFLLFLPQIFAFPPGMATENAVTCGLLVVLLSLAAMIGFAVWEAWGNLLVGLWLCVSPWIVGLEGTQAISAQVMVGIIVAALAKNELWFRSQWRPTGGSPDHVRPPWP